MAGGISVLTFYLSIPIPKYEHIDVSANFIEVGREGKKKGRKEEMEYIKIYLFGGGSIHLFSFHLSQQ